MGIGKRLRFGLAQLGPKQGKGASLAMLIAPSDLPGSNWTLADERTWRAGTVGDSTPWSQRAKEAGCIAGWRSFKESSGQRWAWA